MEKEKKKEKASMFFGINILKTKMCRQPATFKCSFVFKLEELLVSQHRNMSFFVSAFDTSGEGRRRQETFARLGYDVNKWIRGVRWQA